MTTSDQTENSKPPDHLSEKSKRLWADITGREKPKSPGWLTAFTAALECLDRVDECRARIARDGLTFTTEKTGTVHVHPLLRVEKDACAQFARLWERLGLTWG